LNKTSNHITLTFAGDFVPDKKTLKLIHENRMHEFAPGVSKIIKQSDFSIVNLETPLTTRKDPIEKLGNNFMAHPENAKLVKNMGFDAVTLANNHILDQNEQGVLDTINACEKVGLKTVGASKNLDSAKDPLIIEVKNKKIGIINICEQEFNIATENTAGANPFTAIDAFYQISLLKPKVDYLIVIFHGGLEYHHIPLAGFIKNCKFMIDCGADAVVCHHTHYISGYEYYNGKPIFYGLGNFAFNYKKLLNEELHTGLLCTVEFCDKEININQHIISYNRKNLKISLLNEIIESRTKKQITNYKSIIEDKIRLENYWNEISNKEFINLYLKRKYSNKIVRKILSKILIRTNKGWIRMTLNSTRCEAHREFLIYVLSKGLN